MESGEQDPRSHTRNELHVNVYQRALTETRIRRVARRMGLSHFDVLGRCTWLWMTCRQRRTEFLDMLDADIATGELAGFVDALIAEDLAERVDERTIRVRGAARMIRYCEGQQERALIGVQKRRRMSAELQKRASAQQTLGLGPAPGTLPAGPDLLTGSDLLSSPEIPQLDHEALLPTRLSRVQNGGVPDGEGHGSKRAPGASGGDFDPIAKVAERLPAEALELGALLVSYVTKNHPSGRLAKSPQRTRNKSVVMWGATIDKINRLDRMSWSDIKAMIDWSQRDPFWSTTILGADNLREHWDTILGQRNRAPRQVNQPRAAPGELARREAEELERAAAADAAAGGRR